MCVCVCAHPGAAFVGQVWFGLCSRRGEGARGEARGLWRVFVCGCRCRRRRRCINFSQTSTQPSLLLLLWPTLCNFSDSKRNCNNNKFNCSRWRRDNYQQQQLQWQWLKPRLQLQLPLQRRLRRRRRRRWLGLALGLAKWLGLAATAS